MPHSAAMAMTMGGRLAGLLLLLGASCSRTPPEPAPPPPSSRPTPTVAKNREPLAAPTAAPGCPPDPEDAPPLPTAHVDFPSAPGKPRVEVEIAKTPRDTERGLMYRKAMPEEHGMLFRLDERREHVFWMHNTCIPLDMLFVEDDGTIVGIVEDAEPLTDSSRTVHKPSSWVLEVNGGWSQRHGVRAGQTLVIPPEAR